MSTTLLDGVVKKNRARLIPFMLALYVLAFLDRSNIGFAKETYQIDTGLSNEAYALGAGIFFVVYAFLGVPANLLMRKFGARTWIGTTTLLWGFLSAAMAWADTESKFLIIRTLLGAAEAGFFPGMIYLTSQWFPQRNRASIMGLFYMGAPLALTLGSPLSGALLEMHGFMGHPGWFWMFVIEGLLAVGAGIFTFFWLDDTPQQARFLSAEEKAVLISQLTSEEEKKVTSRLSDALRNGRVWQLAIIYLTIQVAVYGLIFFLPTQVAALLGTKVGFTASVVAAIPWVAALFGTWLIPRYSDRTGDRRNVAALTLLAAGIGIGLSGLFHRYWRLWRSASRQSVSLRYSRCSGRCQRNFFPGLLWRRGSASSTCLVPLAALLLPFCASKPKRCLPAMRRACWSSRASRLSAR